MKGRQAEQEAIDILERVGIPDPGTRHRQYPHEFSGGMRQRVVIAIAMACKPRILICDEPTTALDVTIQAQILQLIKTLQSDFGFTSIYITHDLGVVAKVADRVAVMYAGTDRGAGDRGGSLLRSAASLHLGPPVLPAPARA